MINKKELRENLDLLAQRLAVRGVDKNDLLKVKELDVKHNELQKKIDDLNREKNVLSKANLPENIARSREIKDLLNTLNKEETLVKVELDDLFQKIPNIPDDDLTNQQITIREWGSIPNKSFKTLSHDEISDRLSIISFNSSIKIAGKGFSAYCGKGEKLYRALISFTLDENEKKGYQRFYLPEIVSKESLYCTSQISKFAETLFKLENGKYLSPTGEVQLINMFRDEVLKKDSLPIKLTTNTNCFRNESVGAGVESRGIIRMFQFCKTELIVICDKDHSEEIHQQVVRDAEDILIQLELPYRTVQLANDDLGFAASKTYDLEVWLPSENKYREISSVSNTRDFQSRRGSIRFKKDLFDKNEKTEFVHIINGSSLAIDRLFAAIVENYQQEDGTILVPKALQKYLSFNKIETV